MATAERLTCQCPACKREGLHLSDCAVHNGPALPVVPCDCGLSSSNADHDKEMPE